MFAPLNNALRSNSDLKRKTTSETLRHRVVFALKEPLNVSNSSDLNSFSFNFSSLAPPLQLVLQRMV